MAGNKRKKENKEREKKPRQGLNNFKYQIARELGYEYNQGLGELDYRQNGYIGGYMVKKLIEKAKENSSPEKSD